MESQSGDSIPSAIEEMSKSDSLASNNDTVIATCTTNKDQSELNRETDIIVHKDRSTTDALQENATTELCPQISSVVEQMESAPGSLELLQQTTFCTSPVPIPSDAVSDGQAVVNDSVCVTSDMGLGPTAAGYQLVSAAGSPRKDTNVASNVLSTSKHNTQPTPMQDMSADIVVRIKQEKDLEPTSAELPQMTGTSCGSASAGDGNMHCLTNQNDSNESEHPTHVHVTIKEEPSVAFHDLISVADGSDDEKLEDGSTELSCYTLDYRGRGRKDSSSSVDSSDSDRTDSEDAREMHRARAEKQKAATEILKTKGELTLDTLPPLDELHIMLAEDVVMAEVGCVRSIIGPLVVVEAKPDLPALNMDTILFLEGRKVMGQVFETFGPVSSPFYSVRYNCQADIERLGIEPSVTVYYAPSETQYTHYIFLDQLISLKGSDASWEDNNEPPEKFIEFSDDEEERRFKAKKRNKNKGGGGDCETEGKRRPQAQKQNDHQRSRQGQGSATTRQNDTHDSGMPPWRNTTPNAFSQMGRTADRGDSGQCPPQPLQQWPPPTSHVGENSPFSSPPPRPPMFPGINESSMSWRPYNQPTAWNPGHMTQGHMTQSNMNQGYTSQGYMNSGPMNPPSQWNNASPYSQQQQPPNFARGPPGPGWPPFLRHGAQFGERPNFMPGPQNNWHP